MSHHSAAVAADVATADVPTVEVVTAEGHRTRTDIQGLRAIAVAAVVVLVASLALLPRWPIEWVQQLSGYQHFVPLLVLPGPLLALALWRHRDRDSWLLFLSAVMPQRWFYDSFLLWLIPKSRRSILATVACSWVIGVWRWSHTPHTMQQVGRWSVLAFYLPMLVVILTRTGRDEHSALSTQHSANATEC